MRILQSIFKKMKSHKIISGLLIIVVLQLILVAAMEYRSGTYIISISHIDIERHLESKPQDLGPRVHYISTTYHDFCVYVVVCLGYGGRPDHSFATDLKVDELPGYFKGAKCTFDNPSHVENMMVCRMRNSTRSFYFEYYDKSYTAYDEHNIRLVNANLILTMKKVDYNIAKDSLSIP
jgi:hypothetical protein